VVLVILLAAVAGGLYHHFGHKVSEASWAATQFRAEGIAYKKVACDKDFETCDAVGSCAAAYGLTPPDVPGGPTSCAVDDAQCDATWASESTGPGPCTFQFPYPKGFEEFGASYRKPPKVPLAAWRAWAIAQFSQAAITYKRVECSLLDNKGSGLCTADGSFAAAYHSTDEIRGINGDAWCDPTTLKGAPCSFASSPSGSSDLGSKPPPRRFGVHFEGWHPHSSTVAPRPASTAPSTTPRSSPPPTTQVSIGSEANGLQVIACPTTAPWSSGSHRPKLPDPHPPSVPPTQRNGLAVYANDGMFTLAPGGWRCAATEAQDGNDTLTISPAGQPSTNASQGVSATLFPACSSCIGALACTYFSAARKLLGGEPCPPIPTGEQHVQTRPTSVDFADPPHVTGYGFASGGVNPANGVLIFVSRTGDEHAARETCTLPQSQHALCTTILDDFINRYAD
jgi:hypothetical protein